MKQFKVKKGHTPKIAGKPSHDVSVLPSPGRVALLPQRIPFVKPRLLVETGDRVACGAPLIEDKRNPAVRLMAPGGGRVDAIEFGPRRVITRIVIRLDDTEERVTREPLGDRDLANLSREGLIQRLVDGGLWPFLKALPFRDYPPPNAVPPSITVGLDNLEPFQPSPEVYLAGNESLFAFGVDILKKLAVDPSAVYVTVSRERLEVVKPLVNGTLTHAYTGAYPAHDPGVLLYHTRRSPAENRAWFISGQDLLLVAEFLRSGTYPTRRILTVAGTRAPARRHVETRLGAPLALVAPDVSASGDPRFVVGGIFTGYCGRPDSYMGLFQTSLTLLPEGNEREFMALINPGVGKLTYSRTFLSALNPADVAADCNLHGGSRACIACGHCNEVCPVDLLPQLTYKAVLADEIEEFLALGLLDCVECGLCSYVCPSKIDLHTTFKDARGAYYLEQV